MRRLYCIARTLPEADALHALLRHAGIGEWNYHVISRDDVGIYKHHFHAANPLQARDVLRQGERGALIGIVAGLVISLIITGVFHYFGDHRLTTFAVVTALVTMHGLWTGGMVGLQQPNNKLRRFQADLDAGHYVFIVDVDRAHYATVKAQLEDLGRDTLRAEGSPLAMPFG